MFLFWHGYFNCKGITYSWGLSSFFVQPVLYGGFLIKKKNVHVKCNLILFIISIVILFEAYQISGRFVDLASSTIVNPFFFIFVSTVGIYVSWYLSHLIMNNDYLASAVAFVGTYSLHIMALHFLAFRGVSYIYVWIHELPLTKISSAIYLDKNWWLVYSFVGIIMPVILMRTYKYIAKTIKSQIKCLIYR